MPRDKLIQELAQIISRVSTTQHPVRVAIDGVDASGKTTLADELAEILRQGEREGERQSERQSERQDERQIIRASIDGFHNPEHIRRKQGDLSPEGFYYDSYNYASLEKVLLKPLGPQGNRRFQTAVFNLTKNQPCEAPEKTADRDAILLLDGIFLLRPCLVSYWDLTVFIHVDFRKTMARGIQRDATLYGSVGQAAERYRKRYIPGQQLYFQKAKPLDKADILIDNNEINTPKFLRVPTQFGPEV